MATAAKAGKCVSPCEHCGNTETTFRRRGLCIACYQKPWIRSRYKARPLDFCGSGAAPRPSNLTPDDPRKFDEMIQRAARGEQLFSPFDRSRDVNLE